MDSLPPNDPTDRRLVTLAPEDNVCVVCTDLVAGTSLMLDGRPVTVRQDVPLGHKVARRDVAAGQPVIKYGAKIGSATAPISAGDHVHLHNMQSDYIPTYLHADDPRYVGGRGA